MLARRRHGIVTRAELVTAGFSASAIDRRLADGLLVRLYRGVYAVGHRALRPEAHWLAGVLACGRGAVLSHRSAADAWGLRPTARRRIDVTAPRRAGREHAGIDAHSCARSMPDVTALHGIPITTPARTLLDLAEVVPADHLRRAIERAHELRLYDRAAIEAAMARAPGRRGLKPLRAALAAHDPRTALTRSELERRALALVAAHGIPAPEINARIAGHEVDLLWRARRVAVELDGYAFHSSPAAFEGDRRRDADLRRHGIAVLRLTWRQVVEDPVWAAAAIAAALAP